MNTTNEISQFYEFRVNDLHGKEFSFKQLENKVVLIVNTASKCGFVNQFIGFEQLYNQYKDQGLVILGFPCNQFGGEEPGSQKDILDFCSTKFTVTFPMMDIVEVNGEDSNEVYKWLKEQKAGVLGFRGIKWNFEKFLVNRQGWVSQRYSTITTPAYIEGDIRKLLDL